jgi:hypothetical protein
MSGAIPVLPQYTLMAWCLVKAERKLYLLIGTYISEVVSSLRFSD